MGKHIEYFMSSFLAQDFYHFCRLFVEDVEEVGKDLVVKGWCEQTATIFPFFSCAEI